MQIYKVYLKLFLLFALIIGMFYGLKFLSDEGSSKVGPAPTILSTNVTPITTDGIHKIKTEVEIKNNGGKGYIVIEIKASAGDETWEKNIDILMKPKKTQTLQIIFDDRNIANKNPEFNFHAYPFLKK